MITILTVVWAQPGREKDFEELWRQARPTRDRYPGLRRQRLLRDTDQHGRYVVVDEWDGREQFNAYVRASGMLWWLEAEVSWITPHSWSYLEEVEVATSTSWSW